mgnify:FL=1
MHSFEELYEAFSSRFNTRHFPVKPASLYDPAEYFLGIGGKRVRPGMCLMGNELFDEIRPDAWELATAIELFHNFTLIHDDIMDKAPLRRGVQTVHEKFGEPTALLAGDVMMVVAYDYLNKIHSSYLHRIIEIFNRSAKEVCEGQQMDMDFEKRENVSLDEYINMISLKTSVLLAASLKMGAILGGAGEANRNHIYEFGRNLGIAFQVQDDYLDAFGDPDKFGKQLGGDIKSNKKTFLMIHALEMAPAAQAKELRQLLEADEPGKVDKILRIFKDGKVDSWALELKNKFFGIALEHLDEIAVTATRKEPMKQLAKFLVQREH